MNLLIILAFVISGLQAQPARNAAEAKQNQGQVMAGAAQIERDQKEIAEFSKKLSDLDAAWDARNVPEINRLKASMMSDINREIGQVRAKTGQANREVNQSRNEVRSESREVRSDRRRMQARGAGINKPTREYAADKTDRRDDVRDLADDKRDMGNYTSILTRQTEIRNLLKTYQFSLAQDAGSEAMAKKALMKEFLDLMEKDLALTKRELNEDKYEKMEDRRERMDDRR